MKIRFPLIATLAEGMIECSWTESSRRIVPEVEEAIELSWKKAKARLGDRLFDGAVCRLESWTMDSDHLHLALSRGSYRVTLGTHFENPQFDDRFGRDVMGNNLGVSTALLTADGYLLMGRRSENVAYYPSRLHPIAGSIDAQPRVNVFDQMRRELHEELSITPAEIEAMLCLGLAEDRLLRHPELHFSSSVTLTRAEVEARMDREEHDQLEAIPATPQEVGRAIEERRAFTPMAIASLLLWGKSVAGQGWFERHLGDLLD